MPIKPGKCPPAGCPPVTQKDCIEVFKVYDQCVAEEVLGSCVRAADFCPSPIPANARQSLYAAASIRRASSEGAIEKPPFSQRPRDDVITSAAPALHFITAVHQDVLGDGKPGQGTP